MSNGFIFIEPTAAIPAKPLFCVVGGFPGLGKSSLTFTAPGEVFLVDADLGLERAVQKKRPLSTRVTDYAKFKDYVNGPDFEKLVLDRKIKTIGLDTVGALLDDVIAPYLIKVDSKNSRGGGLSLQGYGALKTEFAALLARFFALGLNVIGVCHAKEEGDDATAIKQLRLSVTGGSNEIILRKADMLGFITMRRNKRTLDFNPSDYQLGKNTAQLEAVEIPDALTPAYDDFLTKVFELTYKKMSELSESQLAAMKVQGEISDKIDDFKTLDELNAISSEIEAVESATVKIALKQTFANRYSAIFAELHFSKLKTVEDFNKMIVTLPTLGAPADLKLAVWGKLNSIAEQFGIVYDKPGKAFVKAPNAPQPPPVEPKKEETPVNPPKEDKGGKGKGGSKKKTATQTSLIPGEEAATK